MWFSAERIFWVWSDLAYTSKSTSKVTKLTWQFFLEQSKYSSAFMNDPEELNEQNEITPVVTALH